MGRPKKKQDSNAVYTLKFDKQISGSPITKPNMSYNIVNWGAKNNYPNLLLDLYAQSPTHRAAINFGVMSILGGGIDTEAMQVDGSQLVPNYRESWDDVIKALATDYLLYGSYALQVIMNRDGKTFSFYHTPLEKVRWTEYDADGQITKYAISQDWTNPTKYPPVFVDAFDTIDSNRLKKGVPYLYVYRTYSPINTYYTSPHYSSAIKAIQSEVEYLNYDLRTVHNNFTPSGMLVLNEVSTDEERNAIIRQVQNTFEGSDNANSLMISFRSNAEQQAPQFVPFQASTSNVNLYADAEQRIVSRILAGHGIPSSSLIGIPDIGNTGFASEGEKLRIAFNLYMSLVGNSNRQAIVKTLNYMLAMNGVETELVIKPLYFLGDDQTTSSSDVAEAVDTQDIEDNNIEEQVN